MESKNCPVAAAFSDVCLICEFYKRKTGTVSGSSRRSRSLRKINLLLQVLKQDFNLFDIFSYMAEEFFHLVVEI